VQQNENLARYRREYNGNIPLRNLKPVPILQAGWILLNLAWSGY